MAVRAVAIAGMLLLALMLGACVVQDPSITRTENAGGGAVATPAALPTVAPATFATPTPPAALPTAVPSPVPEPSPTPGITPLTALTPSETVTPEPRPAGPVAVPVGGTTSFVLSESRPIMQLPGHTLIYLDADRLAEVDIFTPIATGEGTALAGYGAVIAELNADPVFSEVDELDPVSIAGFPTRVFEGSTAGGVRSFHTDLSTRTNDSAGWYPPIRVRMWIIDAPAGPIVVSAESLEDPGQYSDAVRLATEILTTITFS